MNGPERLAIVRLQTYYSAKGICSCGHTGSGWGDHADPPNPAAAGDALNFMLGIGACKVEGCDCAHFSQVEEEPEWITFREGVHAELQQYRDLEEKCRVSARRASAPRTSARRTPAHQDYASSTPSSSSDLDPAIIFFVLIFFVLPLLGLL